MCSYTKDQISLIESELTPVDLADIYDDMLDDVYGTVSIAGLNYSTSRALKEVDEVAYRCGMNDYIDSLITDNELTVEINGKNYRQSEVDALLENLE